MGRIFRLEPNYSSTEFFSFLLKDITLVIYYGEKYTGHGIFAHRELEFFDEKIFSEVNRELWRNKREEYIGFESFIKAGHEENAFLNFTVVIEMKGINSDIGKIELIKSPKNETTIKNVLKRLPKKRCPKALLEICEYEVLADKISIYSLKSYLLLQ